MSLSASWSREQEDHWPACSQRNPWLNTSDLNLCSPCVRASLCVSENSEVKHLAQFLCVYSFKSTSHISTHRSINMQKIFWAPQFSLSAKTRFDSESEVCLSNRTTERSTLQQQTLTPRYGCLQISEPLLLNPNPHFLFFFRVSNRAGLFNITPVCDFQLLVRAHSRFTTTKKIGMQIIVWVCQTPHTEV